MNHQWRPPQDGHVMWTRSETDGSLEVESSGQTVETKAHSCNEIPSREHRALDGLNEVGPATF